MRVVKRGCHAGARARGLLKEFMEVRDMDYFEERDRRRQVEERMVALVGRYKAGEIIGNQMMACRIEGSDYFEEIERAMYAIRAGVDVNDLIWEIGIGRSKSLYDLVEKHSNKVSEKTSVSDYSFSCVEKGAKSRVFRRKL